MPTNIPWGLILKGGFILLVILAVFLHFRNDAAMVKDRDAYKASAVEWKRSAESWKASYEAQKSLRDQEANRASTAMTEANASCDARVAEARRSAKAIKEIVYAEPKRDPAGCPVRSLVDPDKLRHALGTPAG